MMTKTELLDLKGQIDAAKTKISELNGKQSMLMQQLKEQFGCSSIKEAEKKIKAMDGKIEKIQEQIEIGTKELEEKYEIGE